MDILLYPTKVQGEGAAAEVAANIRRANEREDLDVLIIGRGGGSIEDLWAFNEEIVVRAIFESQLPIISSVGHETDITLADFVADRRAATPTAAAELATPVTKLDLLGHLSQQQNRLANAASNRLSYQRERLHKLASSVVFRQPERLYDGYLQKLDQLILRLKQKIREYYSEEVQQVKILWHRLEALSLLRQVQRYQEQVYQQERLLRSNMAVIYDHKVAEVKRLSDALLMLDTSRIVARGYAIIQKNEKVIESSQDIKEKDQLTILMRDGQVQVEVKDVKRQKI